MKILVLADVENKSLWDFYDKSKTEGVDLIISCGDLNRHYLEFLESMTNVPLLYVKGNHDRAYLKEPPEGCECIEDTIYNYKGVRILGLGGSMRYKEGGCMYSEDEMAHRIRKLKNNIRMTNGFDILVTHAPVKGYGDMEDLPHRGFDCFNDLLMKWSPKYMLHGHVHKEYGHEFIRERVHPSGTIIINCYDRQMISMNEDDHPARGHTGSMLYDLYTAMQDRTKRYN